MHLYGSLHSDLSLGVHLSPRCFIWHGIRRGTPAHSGSLLLFGPDLYSSSSPSSPSSPSYSPFARAPRASANSNSSNATKSWALWWVGRRTHGAGRQPCTHTSGASSKAGGRNPYIYTYIHNILNILQTKITHLGRITEEHIFTVITSFFRQNYPSRQDHIGSHYSNYGTGVTIV